MFYCDTIGDLKKELSNSRVLSDVDLARKALNKVQALASQSIDTKPLFPSVVKFLVSSDLHIKKLAAAFISDHSSQSDLVLLAINTLVNDTTASNPMVRGLALRTLSNLPQVSLLEYWANRCITGLSDNSAYVRRISAVACSRLHKIDPSFIDNSDTVDTLYAMIRDPDPIVAVNALRTLDEILAEEGGIIINKNITLYLLNHLKTFSEWDLVTVFLMLAKYTPENDDEVFDMMNISDSYLKHHNSAVVIVVYQYFMHLIKSLPHLRQAVIDRASSRLMRGLTTTNPELTHTILVQTECLIDSNPSAFQPHFKNFFTSYVEPAYVRVKKLQLLSKLICASNFDQVMDELTMCATDVQEDIAKTSIQAIAKLPLIMPETTAVCARKLLAICNSKEEAKCQEVFSVLCHMDIAQDVELIKEILEVVITCVPVMEREESISTVVWLLGEYGELQETSAYLLEYYLDKYEDNLGDELKIAMLCSSVKMFMKRPGECQVLLSRLLTLCIEDVNVDVRERAVRYYHLLRNNIEEAQSVVCKHSSDGDES